jgi:hypothetical protein
MAGGHFLVDLENGRTSLFISRRGEFTYWFREGSYFLIIYRRGRFPSLIVE